MFFDNYLYVIVFCQVLKGHDDHVITCLQFCGNRIVSGSDDNTLKVWSAVTGKVSHVLSSNKILLEYLGETFDLLRNILGSSISLTVLLKFHQKKTHSPVILWATFSAS